MTMPLSRIWKILEMEVFKHCYGSVLGFCLGNVYNTRFFYKKKVYKKMRLKSSKS